MRVQTLALCLTQLLLAGSAYAQTTPVDPGPAIQGNSDPAMPVKAKTMHMKKHKRHMHKK